MHYDNPMFGAAVRHATGCLMRGFISWNHAQECLALEGKENNFYEPTEVDEMRPVFEAIAERLVLEDVCTDWYWLATSWAGIDGSTGRSAYVVDFIYAGSVLPDWTVLSFYVTSNGHFWLATPLAEVEDPRCSLATCETNSVWQAIECMCAQL